ncbi:hypothetical protein BT69DRAFT_27478 [Atractiella rhizophila]|nr:hypothetical protein BT69DRAFT_27478 [Atractiella rhizophila]
MGCRDQFYAVIRNLDRKLTKRDLELPTSDTHKILTTCIPIQCRQCGARFFGDEKSRKEYDEHLDWHFRNNRSSNSAVHRNNACVSRALLLSEEAWLSDGLLEPEPSQPVKPIPEAPRKVPFIKAGMTGTRCTVCMEIFHTEWDDDVGEWVWKDAKVNEMGKADHDSCWREVVEGKQRREREAQEERETEEKEKETTQKRRLEVDEGQEERAAKRLKL